MVINFVNKRIEKELKQAATAAVLLTLKCLKQCTDGLELNISIMDFKEIRSLNKRTRKIDKVTDVLSYPNFEMKPFETIKAGEDGQNILLGDMALCLQQAEAQAEENHVSLEDEVVKLVVHSTLHLMGFDHISDEDYKLMHTQERKVLNLYKKRKKADV